VVTRLRPARPEEAELLARWREEPAGPFEDWSGPPPPGAEHTAFQPGAAGGELVVTAEDDRPLGTVQWRPVPYGPGPGSIAFDIGISLRPSEQGRGHGSRAQRLVADYLFVTTAVHRVTASTDVDNVAEQRALLRAGFTREGVLRGAQWRAGSHHDLIGYARLRTDEPFSDVPRVDRWSTGHRGSTRDGPEPGQERPVISSDLAALAARHGVATSYVDWADEPVEVSAGAVVSALAALDVAAGSDAAVAASLAAAEAGPWSRLLPPSIVVRGGSGSVDVHVPEGVEPRLELELEDGTRQALPAAGPVTARRAGTERRTVALSGLPLGWHRLRASVRGASAGGAAAEAVLLVAPARLALPADLDRAWGWMVQLYSLRSAGSWAMGDYADLRTVVERTAADGAGVVLLNPLHAETPVPPINPSPYSPSSRRFRSAIYLRIEDTPEYAAAPDDVRAAVDALRPVAEQDRIPRDPVWRAKNAALELLWPRHRAEDLAAWRSSQGAPLEELALFCALAEQHGTPWQSWPEGLRRPDGPGVAAERDRLADRIAFWCWVQLLVDDQLAGLGSDMVVGVVHDLAVGVDAGGADAWALQDALALGTTVGAPPDSYNQQGQDWGLPPWRPDRLAELGYLPFRDVVRGVLRHAGGLRIDHVMGLFRLWWVPAGAGAAEGTYVSYDSDAMLAVLALEATRAGAVVVGEDLGTVEERVRTSLESTGVLGSAVLWFETDDGEQLPPQAWRELALATVTTHDLPTVAGFLAEEQVRVRAELGQLGLPVEQERERVRKDREALLTMLRTSGLLDAWDGDVGLAMHAVLTAAPSRLVLAAFGDAVGDLRQPNLPGTVDEYPNWRLPVADGSGRPLGLEELLDSPGVRRLTALMDQGVSHPPGPVR